MQYRKCVAFCAALLVGLGAVAADAATVSSVTITSPTDSGTVRGIDSTFTVQAKILDFTPVDSLEVIMYLVTADAKTVVEDGNGTTNFGAKSQVSAIAIGNDVVGAGKKGLTSADDATTLVTTDKVVAVRARRAFAAGSSHASLFEGDGDSIKAAVSGDTTTFTWYGKIHYSSGTVGGVRAAVFAVDSSTQTNTNMDDTSNVSVSSGSLRFDIDADRPVNPDAMVTATSDAVRGQKTGTTAHTVTGFTSASNDQILGISDTLKLDVKLGTQTDEVLIGDSLTVVANLFGKTFPVSKTKRSADTLQIRQIIAEGDYADLVGADNANATDTLAVYIVDKAGNLSSSTDAAAQGVTLPVTFFVDAKKPVLDGGVIAGDTILPVSGDTITDGGLNTGFADDLNPITYNLPEAIDTLFITVKDDSKSTTLKVANATLSIADAATVKDDTLTVDFTSVGIVAGAAASDSFRIGKAGSAVRTYTASQISGDSVIATGVKTLEFQARDLAGNLGAKVTRTNVYVDVDDITFNRLFPTAASGLDTIDESTSKVIFALSEHADSVLITYTGIAGNDNGKTHTRPLVGSELTTLTEQTFTVDSLVSSTQYTLQIVAADLSGNYIQTAVDTFVYDTTFAVPVISTFKIAASSSGLGSPVLAGAKVTLTLQARTSDDRAAVTYKEAAVLKVTGGSGLVLSGTGVDTVGLAAGRANLSADDWITGERVVTLIDTTSIDTLAVTVQDCSDVTNLFTGALDSVIVVNPGVYSQIVLAAADTVGQGDNFWVDVTLADKFGNTRTKDNRFVEVNTNSLGVQLPGNAVAITNGTGGFWANSAGYAGSLMLTARDIVDTLNTTGVTANGNNYLFGKLSVYVDGDGSTVLDDPDTLVAQDYKGASGEGDQGGFVLLTFPVSDDHSTLSGYRIYRELSVDYAADDTGALVALAEPTTAMVPWGRVDAVPGADVMRVVVATLDGDETKYGIAAERGALSSKAAFEGAQAASSPYELMAETMVKSKEVAQLDPGAPVFATLTPEALAFDAQGVVPRLKSVDGVLLSNIRESAVPARAIDDIPPAPVMALQVEDTQGDAGGSITLRWAKSADDRLLSTTVPNAVGEVKTYTTTGVEGYNIYRRIGDGAWTMVGQTAAGETSFEDATVFNGVRYAYRVDARDADNLSESEVLKSAMAIRNNVVDASGQQILGLFGADPKVDIDDFFIFADHFGLTAGADGFDSAFDLSRDNVVDIADFFIFADNFGREMVGAGKVVPTMAGLNRDARFHVDAGSALPRVGEELSVAVSLEDFVEVRGYGMTVAYDSDLLEFVEPRIGDNPLGAAELSAPRVLNQGDGQVTIGAFGETVSDRGLALNLIFRTKQEVESSFIEVSSGALQDGSYGLNRITSPVSVRVETRPEVYALADNYPNPFNPETTIKYQLPEAGQVTLEVFNMLGQVVRTLVNNEFQNAGRYALQWDATNDGGQALSSGVYFYRITAGGKFQSHKKMLLLK